jgi:rubrerythrin
MGGKSIAGRAAAIKQRQKMAHASGYMQRLEDAKKDENGKPLPQQEINTQQLTCVKCGHRWWFKTMRCPECNGLQN